MSFLRHLASFVALTGLLCAWPALVAATEPDIGVFTAVEGRVSVQHSQSPQAITAKLRDTVLFKDLIETQKESRTKALLYDDSILTIGEHSRVEVTEHLFDPRRNLRSVVVNLVQGQVRALVGRVFAGSGSKFEIHTPTAVAAARGTYFVIWHIDGASGVANIGNHGDVDFQSGGRTVSVTPGTFSLTPPGGGPPASPSPVSGSNVPAQVTAAVRGTEVPSTPDSESPAHAAAASGGTAPVQSPPASANVPSVTSGAASSTASQSGITTPSASTTGITPPAVISGAVPPPPPPPSLPSPPPPPPGGPTGGHGIGIGPGGLPPGQGGIVPGTGETNPGQGGSHSNRPR